MSRTKPPDREEIRLKIPDAVNDLALSAAKLLEQLPHSELVKVEREFGERIQKVRKNAASFKRLTMIIGFMYVEAIKAARDERLAKSQPLPNQQQLFPERTQA